MTSTEKKIHMTGMIGINDFFRRTFLAHAPTRYAVMQPPQADRKYDDYPGQLTDQQINQHLAGTVVYAVPYAVNGLATVLAFDIDAGGLAAARDLLNIAAQRGLWAFGTVDPSRDRGYVYIPMAELVAVSRLHTLGEQIISQLRQPGYRIENRAHGADTRLPLARHAWNHRRGLLLWQDALPIDLDQDEETFRQALAQLVARCQPNAPETLPAAPSAPPVADHAPRTNGTTIAAYNQANELVQLLTSYGAKQARGKGQKLYFCPFHSDDHASLLITRDGRRCRCLSTGSGCPLGEGWHDAFSIFCIGEQITPAQAVRRLNGLPDDPQSGPGNTSSPRSARNEAGRGNGAPHTRNAAQRPAQPVLALPATTASSGQRTPATCPGQPKTARRIWAIIAQQHTYRQGVPTLARLLDVDPRTIQRNLRRLEAAGLVRRINRGDYQTDLYQALPPRQMPPTVVLDSFSISQQEITKRGGNTPDQAKQADPAPVAQPVQADQAKQADPAPVAQPVQADQAKQAADGAFFGPFGAVVYPGGAAYVPPEAERWYAQVAPPPVAEAQNEPDHVASECPQMTFMVPPHMQADHVPSGRQKSKKKRGIKFVQPAELEIKIIKASRRADKLAQGKAVEQRQARAIRRQVEHLRRQLAGMYAELEAEAAQEVAAQETAAQLRAQQCGPEPLGSRKMGTAPEAAPPLGFQRMGDLIDRLRRRVVLTS